MTAYLSFKLFIRLLEMFVKNPAIICNKNCSKNLLYNWLLISIGNKIVLLLQIALF